MILPDPEAIFVLALRAQTTITAIVNDRISTDLAVTFPAVRVTLISGSGPIANTGRPAMQWEAWADTEAAAASLAKIIDAAAESLAGDYTEGKIVSSWRQGQYFHSRDDASDRDRYIGQIGLLTQ